MGVFKRYTDQAKRAIYFARFEAVHRQAKAITAEDLLIGLTWEEGSRADCCAELKNRAVELRALVGIPHRPISSKPYDDKENIPLNDDAKKILAYAIYESDRWASYWIDTDHLLRAMLRFDNPAKRSIEACGLTLSGLRKRSRVIRREVPPPKVPLFRLAEYWLIHFGLMLALVVIAIMGAVHSFMNNWGVPWGR